MCLFLLSTRESQSEQGHGGGTGRHGGRSRTYTREDLTTELSKIDSGNCEPNRQGTWSGYFGVAGGHEASRRREGDRDGSRTAERASRHTGV